MNIYSTECLKRSLEWFDKLSVLFWRGVRACWISIYNIYNINSVKGGFSSEDSNNNNNKQLKVFFFFFRVRKVHFASNGGWILVSSLLVGSCCRCGGFIFPTMVDLFGIPLEGPGELRLLVSCGRLAKLLVLGKRSFRLFAFFLVFARWVPFRAFSRRERSRSPYAFLTPSELWTSLPTAA